MRTLVVALLAASPAWAACPILGDCPPKPRPQPPIPHYEHCYALFGPDRVFANYVLPGALERCLERKHEAWRK